MITQLICGLFRSICFTQIMRRLEILWFHRKQTSISSALRSLGTTSQMANFNASFDLEFFSAFVGAFEDAVVNGFE